MAKILVVDDHPINRQFLTKLLGYFNHTVVEAADGHDALDVVQCLQPDLIITDIVMPHMDGPAFVKALRALELLAKTPVVFYTASHRVPDALLLAQEAGVTHVVHKPARPEEILKVVNEILGAPTPAPAQDSLPLNEDSLRLAALTELGLDLTRETDPAKLVRKFCLAMRYLVNSMTAGILILDPNGTTVRHAEIVHRDRPALPPGDHAVLALSLGRILGKRAVTRLNMTDLDPALVGLTAPVRSLLVAALPLPGQSVETAWLFAADREGAAGFTSEDERMAVTLATQAVIGFDNAYLYAALQQRASELEREVVERRNAEQALRASEELFRNAFDCTNVAMGLTDLNHLFVRVNAAFARLVGYTEAEMLTMSMVDIMHPDDIAESHAHRKKLMDGEIGYYQVEKRFLHRDGHILWGLTNVSLVRDASGKPQQFVAQVQDLTERKNLEEQFRQSQKMEAIGRLAGGVAHDFNNLLTVINGYSEVLLGSLYEGDPLVALTVEIKKAGERAAGLTRQLLAFSRKQILVPISLNLTVLLSEMEKMLRRLIGEDIDLSVTADPNVSNVKADAGQMEQVVMNLVVNARDAMPRGGKLTLETRNVELDATYATTHTEARPGRYVLLAVSDTGHGMDPSVRASIFEPFFTTKGDRGTGLGLAMVFGTVKQSGGHIEVYSEPGVGTTFKIYLPQEKEALTVARVPAAPSPLPRGTETILLAEDEEGVRKLIRLILQSNGYTVLEASNGGEALLLCETHSGPINLLVTDVVMPTMSGRQLAERLQRLRPDLRVLYVSGYTDDAIVHHGVLESDMPFLPKPFTADTLARKVREVLNRR